VVNPAEFDDGEERCEPCAASGAEIPDAPDSTPERVLYVAHEVANAAEADATAAEDIVAFTLAEQANEADQDYASARLVVAEILGAWDRELSIARVQMDKIVDKEIDKLLMTSTGDAAELEHAGVAVPWTLSETVDGIAPARHHADSPNGTASDH
jgi:DNA-binding helix-hairpin-helix protein with protein kinase domain